MNELFPVKYSETDELMVSARENDGDVDNDKVIVNPRVVYVLLAMDNTVKVGITSNFKSRSSAIESASGKKIIKYYHTEICSNAYSIEAETKRRFSEDNICGEWFSCEFDEMVNFVKKKFLEMAEVNYVSREEREKNSERLMKFVKELFDCNGLKSSFFIATQGVLSQIWAYQYALETKEEFEYSEKVFSIYERIWEGLMDLSELYTEEQYNFLMNYDCYCMNLVNNHLEK